MAHHIFSPRRLFWIKLAGLSLALTLLFWKSEARYSNIPLIAALLPAGYLLGRVTCSLHFKAASLQLTVAIFVLMNIIHSFTDGLSYTGQAVLYWLTAVAAHELIRQPALYAVLWTLLQPAAWTKPAMLLVCIACVTAAWMLGMVAGAVSGPALQHLSVLAKWAGYSIFLFIGDIIHHFADQYKITLNK